MLGWAGLTQGSPGPEVLLQTLYVALDGGHCFLPPLILAVHSCPHKAWLLVPTSPQ